MFVTSDIFDHKAIARFRGYDWRETLQGGVDVHGTTWPGYQAAARFMLEASQRCGLHPEMLYAGYNLAHEPRTRNILVKSFDRLVRGELAGARLSESVLLTGARKAPGTEKNQIIFGGSARSIRHRRGPTGAIPLVGPPWRFKANFVFPLDEDPVTVASDLFRLAVNILGAEYAYLFVRDEMGGPGFYTSGIVAPLDYKPRYDSDAMETGDWYNYVLEGRLWSGDEPMFRDLFQVNLLSQRHQSARVEGVGLLDWIAAGLGRGQLDDVGQGRWLWALTDAEMVAVRPLLNGAGLLVSCLPRVYRDLAAAG